MEKRYTINDLIAIVEELRGENGCPWDKVQTHESVKKSMIEETYEAIDALNKGDDAMFANELGDVLLQVVFHAQIAKERGAFQFDDCVQEICTKLISRHTHIFGDDKVSSAEETLLLWEKNKKKEQSFSTQTDVLESVPHNLPALMRAEKVQKKASDVGFDWNDVSGAIAKIKEEADEVVEAIDDKNPAEIEAEIGDLLFSVVNVARFLKVNPEIALMNTTERFIDRFSKVENKSNEMGKTLSSLSDDEKNQYWIDAKS